MAGETKVSLMTYLDTVPDDAKIYVVKPGDTTPYYTTKAALLAGISGVTTPGLDPVLGVGAISDKSMTLKNTVNDKRKLVFNPNTVNGPALEIYEEVDGASVCLGSFTSYSFSMLYQALGGADLSWDPFVGLGITDGTSTIAVNQYGVTANGEFYEWPTTAGGGKLASETFVNSLIEGVKTKNPVRVATIANITLSGTQTIDGVSVAVGDRVLVKNQSTQSQNGIYVCASGAWARTDDANTATELTSAVVSVLEGTANTSTTYRQITTSITLGSSNIVWQVFGTLVPDADSSTKGKMKLYTVTGTNTDGTITQALFKSEIDSLNTAVTNLGTSKSDNDVIILTGGAITAQNGKHYIGTSSTTINDFSSPTVGQGYTFYVSRGNVAVGADGFYQGTFFHRYYDGSAWRTDVMLNTRGGKLSGELSEAKSTDIASSTNPSIGLSATGNLVHITGTTTINGFDNAQAGTRRVVVFDGVLTLTHSTNLVLPGATNILTAVNDVAVFICEGSSQWRCVSYQRASTNPTFLDFTSSGQNQIDAKQQKSDYMKLTSAYTLASSTSLQKLFNVGSGSGGAYNAGANRTIHFECVFYLTGLSGSTGDLSFGVLGTAGISSIAYLSVGSKNSSLSNIAAFSTLTTVTTATLIGSSNTGVTARFVVHGTIVTSTAGTIILSVATGVATGACQVGVNSFAQFDDIGADTLTATSNIS